MTSLRRLLSIVAIFVGVSNSSSNAFAQYTPTISGVNAFWYLGQGILANGGQCSGYPGPCYYAQSQLTSNPNGAPGTPQWSIVQNGQGQVTLSCYTCANPVATAVSPSGGCLADIHIYVSYGGYSSASFDVTIVAPSSTNLLSGYPQHGDLSTGFSSVYFWNVVDSCGNSDSGIDANEQFGTFVNDTANNWSLPTQYSVYMTGSIVGDQIAHVGGTPPAQNHQTPLGTTKIRHNYPWALRVGTQTFGSGTPVRVDTQQQWQDHGTHQ